MATYNVSSGSWTYRLTVTETSVNTADNTSTVTVLAQIYRTSQYIQNLHYTTVVTINGSAKTIGSNVNVNHTFSSSSPTVTIGSGTFTVAHNENGTGTATIYVSYTNTDGVGSPASASGGAWYQSLTTIARNPLMALKKNGSWYWGKVRAKANSTWHNATKIYEKINNVWVEDSKKG